MLSLTPVLNDSLSTPLYMQLYSYIRDSIMAGDIAPNEKLPSLRSLARSLKLSLTTVDLAYRQLDVEGYLYSKPQSGFFVADISGESTTRLLPPQNDKDAPEDSFEHQDSSPYFYDPATFDFTKWKKCYSEVLTDHSRELFREGDIRGEAVLRQEISKYIYQARGARCHPDQIVIGAGTQQLISLLCVLLERLEIEHVSFEEPGYQPVRSIFKDRGFKMNNVPLDKDGIRIDKLPVNIKSTVYVSPSNQFPTGSVMPIARRYALLEWAALNDSIIIEDDYNSELRYSARPVPSLQGLDSRGRVVYLGSFSSTLFPSVKISYMVLPAALQKRFRESLGDYTQTCSKAEQLALALYMEKGYYLTELRKLKKLYGQKIQIATQAFRTLGGDRVKILNNTSGLHMLIEIRGPRGWDPQTFLRSATANGLPLFPVPGYISSGNTLALLFYYTRIPLDRMEDAVGLLLGDDSFFPHSEGKRPDSPEKTSI